MKITIATDVLNAALKNVEKAIKAQCTLPILECVYIEATKSEIRVIASSIDFEIAQKVYGLVEEEGNTALIAKIFIPLVSKIHTDEITIEAKDNKAVITGGKKTFEVPVEIGDFPLNEKEINKGNFEINGLELKSIIAESSYPCKETDTNPNMAAVLFDTSGKMVGLDSCRIALREFDGIGEKVELIVPSANLKKAASILINEPVTVTYSDRFIRFTTPSFIITSILNDGKFFNVDNLLSFADFSTVVTELDKNDFISALETLSIFISASDKKPVVLDITNDCINLSVATSKGKGTESIGCTIMGNDLKIGFSPQYLIQAIKATSDDNFTLNFHESKTPLHITGDKYHHVVMPVTIV